MFVPASAARRRSGVAPISSLRPRSRAFGQLTDREIFARCSFRQTILYPQSFCGIFLQKYQKLRCQPIFIKVSKKRRKILKSGFYDFFEKIIEKIKNFLRARKNGVQEVESSNLFTPTRNAVFRLIFAKNRFFYAVFSSKVVKRHFFRRFLVSEKGVRKSVDLH